MTLKSQLWTGIVTLMFVSFVGSLLVSNIAARDYLEEQLRQKNIDNANSLALSLASAPSDPVTREILLSAQFDTGHYQYIEVAGADPPLFLGSREPAPPVGVPVWFVGLFPIEPAPGVAQISEGWKPIGTLRLASELRFAYTALWRNALQLCAYFAVAALLFGALGTLLLRGLTRPLAAVVEQAKAIGERHFVRIAEPRAVVEFHALARAMNALSDRVEQMVTEESKRLADALRESVHDPLTGLLTREPFMGKMRLLLEREDGSSAGTLVIVRLMQLDELNRRHGRAVLDTVLRRIGERLLRETEEREGMIAGRLNGSELAVCVPQGPEPADLGLHLRDALVAACGDCSVDDLAIVAGATLYGPQDALPHLLQRADQAVAAAEQQESSGVEVALAETSVGRSSQDELRDWSERLDRAFAQDGFRLQTYPVRGRDGALLHWEAPSRLVGEAGELVSAARFMPWVARLGRMTDLDLVVVRVAQRHVEQRADPLGINLSARILENAEAMDHLIAQIASAPETASMLWIEVPESGVYARLEGFRRLCGILAPLGCRIGIEHAGPRIAEMGALLDLGLHYVKLDASLSHDIDRNRGNQVFVQGFCMIAHAIGLQAIAEGVRSREEWETLLALGIDGATGPFFG